MRERHNLFLIELVINLFLFGVSAAVCVGLLLYARGVSRESEELTRAVYLAQSIAEDWKGGGDLPRGELPGGGGLQGTYEEHDGYLDISIWSDGRLIYTIEGVSRLGQP